MIFNSFSFLIFFLVFFFLYWLVFNRSNRIQNIFILITSYIFLVWWDWRFLLFLIGSSVVNYLLGIYIAKTEDEKRQRFLFILGLIQGLGGLLFFKYYNFFVNSFVDAFALFNIHLNIHTLHLILPLGISFYTFRAIGYLLDIKSGKGNATTDWVIFFSYMAFFPSLLAGPIDKARDFIPQLEKERVFNYAQVTDGLRQILWGLFKKIVIADYCAKITDMTFDDYSAYPGGTLLLSAFLYTIQIYADFSGYSDMAIGLGRMFGFNLTKNFNFPFFAQNISEFWQRWHISLTTWMTEYVFTPLSFVLRDYGKRGMLLAIMITFILIGLWHGANWTFVVYGFIHGCYFIPLILKGAMNTKRKENKKRLLPTIKEFLNMTGIFVMVMFTLITFRSDSIRDSFLYITRIISSPLTFDNQMSANQLLLFIGIFMLIEWIGRWQEYAIEKIGLKWPRILRWVIYICVIFLILYYSDTEQQFIYAQF